MFIGTPCTSSEIYVVYHLASYDLGVMRRALELADGHKDVIRGYLGNIVLVALINPYDVEVRISRPVTETTNCSKYFIPCRLY